MHVYMDQCVHCICTHMHTYAYMHIHKYTYACAYIYMCVYTDIYIHSLQVILIQPKLRTIAQTTGFQTRLHFRTISKNSKTLAIHQTNQIISSGLVGWAQTSVFFEDL